jgi:hypothetical protein
MSGQFGTAREATVFLEYKFEGLDAEAVAYQNRQRFPKQIDNPKSEQS